MTIGTPANPHKTLIVGPLPEGWGDASENPAAVDDLTALRTGARGDLCSRGKICFDGKHPLCDGLPEFRSLRRFDFQREWNNLGYGDLGRERWEGRLYRPRPEIQVLAWLEDEIGTKLTPYMALKDEETRSTLWVNRSTEPCDGFDSHIIERFFSDHRQALGLVPVLTEIPVGFDAAVTMRIDCDEAVASGRALFELYRERRVPFSMAIKTDQALNEEDFALMREVIAAGGSIVSHSHTHAPNWGGSREAARWELEESHRRMRAWPVEGLNFDYAVSPFHQNPLESVRGLADAGLKAFVGGIICNDPDMLFEKARFLEAEPRLFSHSQQCMLHGETYEQQGGRLDVYLEAFRTARETGRLFGFLDHPFSNYHYGWKSEEQRLTAHAEFLRDIEGSGKIWMASLTDALDFLWDKLTWKWREEPGGRWRLYRDQPLRQDRLPWVRYGGTRVDAREFLS